MGDKTWLVSRSYEEVRAFAEFIREQMHSLSDQFNYKKLPVHKSWQSYLEFQRQIKNVENIFLCIVQNCDDLSFNCIISFLYFVQVSAVI